MVDPHLHCPHSTAVSVAFVVGASLGLSGSLPAHAVTSRKSFDFPPEVSDTAILDDFVPVEFRQEMWLSLLVESKILCAL